MSLRRAESTTISGLFGEIVRQARPKSERLLIVIDR